MRAAIYARVSSQMQRDSQTIESQLRTLPAFVKSQGWQLVETYVDDGKSAKTGKLERRDGFARMMRDAEARRFDVVVVVDVNRLSRTESIEERAKIFGPLQRLGIQIATPSGVQDLRSFMGEAMVLLQSLNAAEENRKRSEATRRGQSHRAREGGKPRGRTPYGLAYDAETRAWSLHAERSKYVREIFRRVGKGESCIAIAYDFNARSVPAPAEMWNPWTVRRIVIARYPVGEWTASADQRIVVRVPAAVDESMWQRAQAALSNGRLRGLRRTKHFQLLESIATCGVCDRPIVIHRARSGFYYCKGRRRHQPGETICTAKPVPCPDVDDRVWETVLRAIEDPSLAKKLAARADADAPKDDTAKLKADLARFTKAEQTFMERYSRGLITDESLDAGLEKLRKDRARTEERLRAASPDAAAPSPEAWLFGLRRLAHSGSPEDQQRVVRAVVKRAVVVGERVRLRLRFDGGFVKRSCPSTHNEATVEIQAVA